jgi:catechol 2,3-dioxygenase-like lactoylglutathione lyase family enzyme
MVEPRRMQLTGLHHITLISGDIDRTIAFYRDLLGLAVIKDGVSDDDASSRHVWFGAIDGTPGRVVSFMEYPQLPAAVVGTGAAHHFAFSVETGEELEAWRDYLRERGVECSEVFDRGAFRSLYLRDPDSHIVEIATRSPGLWSGPVSAPVFTA